MAAITEPTVGVQTFLPQDSTGLKRFGELLTRSGILTMTINIPDSPLTDDVKRQDYMQALFQGIGSRHQFLNATVREDVQREDPEHVRLMDGYFGQFRAEYQKLHPEMPMRELFPKSKARAEELLVKYFESVSQGIEFVIDDGDLQNGDHDAIKNALREFLLSKQARAACNVSHLRALQEGGREFEAGGIKAVLITEDDIQFTDEASRVADAFDGSLQGLRGQDWDILMLGASDYVPRERRGTPSAETVSGCEHIVKVNYSYGNYAYLVNGSSIEKVIGIIQNFIEEKKGAGEEVFAQDVVLSDRMSTDLKVFGCNPKIIGPMTGCYSVICNQKMDYSMPVTWVVDTGSGT